MSQENVEIVRRFTDAFNKGDREAVSALLHPAVEWHTMTAPILGVDAVRGRDETVRFIFEQIQEAYEDFGTTTDRITELPGGALLVVGTYTGRGVGSGAVMKMDNASIFRCEGGVIVFFQDFASEAEAVEAVGLPE